MREATTASRSAPQGGRFPTEGSDFVVDPIPGGGFTTRFEDGETVYYFPVSLLVNDRLTEDMHILFEVNVHEGFRWIDNAMTDHEPCVFDMTPLGTEPIAQAGANDYSYRVSETGRP